MKFRDTKIYNFDGAIRGMRNPMKSWESSDSIFGYKTPEEVIIRITKGMKVETFNLDPSSNIEIYVGIGQADMKRMQNLVRGGADHAKFMRQIMVSVDITAPRYFWSEFDTYHFNTKNSESTMHKLLNTDTPFSLDDFERNGDPETEIVLKYTIETLEMLRKEYKVCENTKRDSLIRKAKMILPESFLQKRTITTNYAELRNIYRQRKNHRLPEWKIYFINWIKSLPFAEELICLD